MSPVWVKLGDFGVSKRIKAQATTTFHTQVSTPVYSAPEVLGLDSNSDTSYYTNSVDIWSLGCVIYELLVGTKLFLSESQVSRYYFGKWHFPEDTLQGLSPPTDDLGISLLKSMLIIRPEDRPTAADALSHGWFAGLQRNIEDSGGDGNGLTQNSVLNGRVRPSRTKTDDVMSSRPVFFRTCPAALGQGLGSHIPPREMSRTSCPAVSRSSQQSPQLPALPGSPSILLGVESRRVSPTFLLSFLHSFCLHIGMPAALLFALFLMFLLVTRFSLP